MATFGLGSTDLQLWAHRYQGADPRNKSANYTQFEAPFVNEKRASVHDDSGQLQATAVTNDGTFTVAPSASLTIVPGTFADPRQLCQQRAVHKRRDSHSRPGLGPTTWSQAGGPISGHEIVLKTGSDARR